MRWVQRYIPVFEKKWKKYARPVGSSWRVDETYIKVKGKWHYIGGLYLLSPYKLHQNPFYFLRIIRDRPGARGAPLRARLPRREAPLPLFV